MLLAAILSAQLLLSVAQAPHLVEGESAATQGSHLVASSAGWAGERTQGRKLGTRYEGEGWVGEGFGCGRRGG